MRRAATLALLLAVVALSGASAAAEPDLAAHVNPFTGTSARAADFGTGGGAGNTFPGATAPFGMIQWSPDTVPSAVNYAGGYTWEDERLRDCRRAYWSISCILRSSILAPSRCRLSIPASAALVKISDSSSWMWCFTFSARTVNLAAKRGSDGRIFFISAMRRSTTW